MTYEEIQKMRREAVTFHSVANGLPLRKWLEQFIIECDSYLPSHNAWLEDEEHIVIEDLDNGWKHIICHVQFEYEGLEEICYACVKRYELKHQIEPDSYNQAPPGLYKRYRYLYKIKISHETWLAVTKLYCHRLLLKRHKELTGG